MPFSAEKKMKECSLKRAREEFILDFPDLFGEGSSFGRYRAFLHRMNIYLERLTREYSRVIKQKKVEPDQYTACIMSNDNNLVYLVRQMKEFFDVLKHSYSMFDKLDVLDRTIHEDVGAVKCGWSDYIKAIRQRTEMLKNVLSNRESFESIEETINAFQCEYFANETELQTSMTPGSNRKRRKLERVSFSTSLEDVQYIGCEKLGQPPPTDEDFETIIEIEDDDETDNKEGPVKK